MANPYKLYLSLHEPIDPTKHIIGKFALDAQGEPFDKTAGGVASESSVGTWTDVGTEIPKIWEKLHAKVTEIDEHNGFITIAYPLDLFEFNNLPQLLSSIAGNIFGLKEITRLNS